MIKTIKGGAILTALTLCATLPIGQGWAGQSVNKINQASNKQSNTISNHFKAGGQVCGTDENGQTWVPSPNEGLFFGAAEPKGSNKLNSKLNLLSADDFLVENQSIGVPDEGEYIIPVVFHVYGAIHNCESGGSCVPDSLIANALKRSNEDFQGLNTLDGPIASQFQAIRENMNVEFVLAKIDPWGNPTNGIVRHGEATGYGNYEAPNDEARAAKDAEIAADAWDNYRYMNIYIMNDIDGDGATNNSGVAWYPTTSMSDAGLARVVYNGAYLGTNTDENFRSILTHEFGHWLNLPHVFDGAQCNTDNEIFCSHTGDRVCDTPQMSSNSMANNAENCLGQATNTENFMHYTDNYAMFTQQQAQRMYGALNHPARSSLWTDDNLISVGLSAYTSSFPHNWDGSGVDAPPEGTVLMELPGLSALKGEINTYTIDLPTGTEVMAVYLDGFSEDPDLYVRHGQAPSYDGTNWTYDLFSFSSAGTPEFIGLVGPKTTGTYHITIDAFSAYTNARLIVVAMDDPTLCNGCERVTAIDESGLAAVKGSAPKHYSFTVPNDATRVMVEIPGGYGSTLQGGPDPDLYVSRDIIPTTSVADCKPFAAPGLREVCEFTGADLGGTYNIMIDAFLDYSDVSLKATYDHPVSHNQLPTAVVNGPYSATLGSPISFSSNGSSDVDGTIASYSWDFGDGSLSTDANPVHTYLTADNFNVTLTVTDDLGGIATSTTNAVVTHSGLVELRNGVAKTGVSANTGDAAKFFITVPAGATNLVVKISGGTGDADLYTQLGSEPTDTSYVCRPYIGGNSETCTEASPTEGVWYVNLKAYNTFADVTLLATFDAGTENVAPTANANGAYTGSAGQSIQFSSQGSNDSDGNIVSFEWDFGDGSASTLANPSHAYSVVQNYTVTLTVTDNGGLTHSSTTTASVTGSQNVAPVAMANGPYSGEVDSAISFSSQGSSDSDGSIASYSWDFGDGNTSSQASPNHTYVSAGDYTVTLTVTDNLGATGTSVASASVSSLPVNGLVNACSTQAEEDYITPQSGAPICVTAGSDKYFYFYADGVTQTIIRTQHGTGDVALYYSQTGWPSSSSYTQVSNTSGNTETITVNGLATGWHYILVGGSHSGVTLRVDMQ
ncbi:PKD domain-containing protein [Shewanella sp. UCD-KL12]|uniref:PKD domain-containing protein n=1 Tax=Shewanella sp. UCD-KL12 TaxID=1917163 RepID=UPI00211717BB|nr:PKD domain-containing protein [Shewanella sp. UCD-KL12]